MKGKVIEKMDEAIAQGEISHGRFKQLSGKLFDPEPKEGSREHEIWSALPLSFSFQRTARDAK